MNDWAIYLLSAIFLIGGIMHFIRPNGYVSVMPSYIPMHRNLVYISGVTEIIAGILLLFPETRSLGAIGVIIMLILFMPVHIYMVTPNYTSKIPRWVLWVRIPLQFLLIYWAYLYV